MASAEYTQYVGEQVVVKQSACSQRSWLSGSERSVCVDGGCSLEAAHPQQVVFRRRTQPQVMT